MAHIRGEGSIPCMGTAANGLRCTNMEIEGLEYCLHHIPDDMLEEAEEITGTQRCRHRYGQHDACRYYAIKDTEPPRCKNHGANIGAVISLRAASRGVENRATERLGKIMSEEGDRLTQPGEIGNPLTELLTLAAEMRALKDILRDYVAKLKVAQWRYSGTRTGEQLRAEVLLYERGLDRYASILISIAKLNISERLAAIEERQVATIERALTAALQASGADLEGQDAARQVLKRELRRVS